MPAAAPPAPSQEGNEIRPVTKSESDDGGDHEPQFEPVVSLPLVTVPTHEEDEVEMCRIRARLYRFDKTDHEWKERGTGDIKLMHHLENNTVRVVMRRDKTLKICANHFITEDLQLNNHIGSDRAFNWTTLGDFADETTKTEFLAVKFGNAENAKIWKSKFLEAINIVKSKGSLNTTRDTNDDSNSDPISISDSSSDNSILSDKQSEDVSTPDGADQKNENNDEGFIAQLSDLKLEKEPTVSVE